MRVILFLLFVNINANAQFLSGYVVDDEGIPLSSINISINELSTGTSSNIDGYYKITSIPKGVYEINFTSIGKESKSIFFEIEDGENILNVSMDNSNYSFSDIVVTATRVPRKKKDSPIIVNLLSSENLHNLQACNLSEALNFQPGLRVEVDCQTCNYSQLRINGLAGGYSKILINGRPIFSPLLALYGLEQLPTSMIDRIETVRGGGSAIYGSSAIAGVVNVITKVPRKSGFNINYNYSLINLHSENNIVNGDLSFVNSNKNGGLVFFFNSKKRNWYDHNDDNFSELPKIDDFSFGSNIYLIPSKNQKIEFSISKLNEYRYGGEMIDELPHFSLQSEERVHDILLANLDYQYNSGGGKWSLISYFAMQNAKRDHYTGIRPEINSSADTLHLINPPYGFSDSQTKQIGLQLSRKLDFLGTNVVTFGADLMNDAVIDEIEVYDYKINQNISTLAFFVQSDWNIANNLNLLSGVRFDSHSLLDNVISSPRFSVLYRINDLFQFRSTYSSGFRAPQAFDSDLHMAFAGGGVSTIELSDNLSQEESKSFNFSLSYNRVKNRYFETLNLEFFYTFLDDNFYYELIGQNEVGEQLVKRNGDGAVVKGVTLEGRLNLLSKMMLESSFTFQSSLNKNPVNYSVDLPSKTEFLRSPNRYGYVALDYFLSNNLSLNLNLIYTGSMDLLHVSGAPEQLTNSYFATESFNVLGLRASYLLSSSFPLGDVEFSLGVKNLTNAYQNNFDTTKNRDSNFVYGPSFPRTFYINLNIFSP